MVKVTDSKDNGNGRVLTPVQQDWCKAYYEITNFEPTLDSDTGQPFLAFQRENLIWFMNYCQEMQTRLAVITNKYLDENEPTICVIN